MIAELRVGDAGEVLTIQRAAYVTEGMAYNQFLPPLTESLDEIREFIARAPGVDLWLFAGERSEGNRRLYRRLGFVETHRAPFSDHLLVYRKRPRDGGDQPF